VIFYLLHGNVPTLDRMTLCAIRTHLSLVDVRVAVLTILSHVRENGLHVALCALDFFVHTPQRIPRFVVVELGNSLNGPPSRSRVTVLARDRQRAMRTLSRAALLALRKGSAVRLTGKEQHPEQEFEISRRMTLRGRPHNWSSLRWGGATKSPTGNVKFL